MKRILPGAFAAAGMGGFDELSYEAGTEALAAAVCAHIAPPAESAE